MLSPLHFIIVFDVETDNFVWKVDKKRGLGGWLEWHGGERPKNECGENEW